MERNNNYTIIFTIVLCVISSIALTLVSKGLETKKDFNIEIDRQMNVLKAFGFEVEGKKQASIAELYKNSVEEFVIDKNGNIVKNKNVKELDPIKDVDFLAVYKAVENGSTKGYAIPIVGYGLWSWLYGYLAFSEDFSTIKGITFYKQGETPGLGAEIESKGFQEKFINKKIFDANGKLRIIRVVKGIVKDAIPDKTEYPYYVDGISGATMTCDGVNNLLKSGLEKYEPFFNNIRKGIK